MIRQAAAAICLSAFATGALAEGDLVRNFDDLEWDQRAPIIAVAPVWQDAEKGVFGLYVRIKAGATVPHHTHTASYHGVVLQGNWRHYYGEDLEDGHSMTIGDYAHQAGTEVHTDGCEGPEDCVFYAVMTGTPDSIPFVKE